MLSRFLTNAVDFAVDLGTANTLIGSPGRGVLLNEPSVVAVETESRRVLSGQCAVGHLARQMQGRTPDSITVVQPLRQGVVADFAACEAMLRYFLVKLRPRRFSSRPRLLMGVPGAITPVEKRALFNSALRAGAGQVLLVPDAKAAAIGAGLPIAEPVANLICDIGSGTTEVAIITLGDVAASQSIRVGGESMDQAIVDYLRRNYSLQIGAGAAEQLKLDIGSAWALEEEKTAMVRGVDSVAGMPRKATITSEEIREALLEPLNQIVEAIRSTVDACSAELAGDLVDQGLVLAGGGAMLRGLDHYLTERTGLPVRVAPNPDEAVITGVLRCLQNLPLWRSSLESSDDEI